MQKHSGRPTRMKAWAFLSIAMLCTAVACNNLLDVKSPDAINATSLDNPLIAEQTVNASIGDFDCALSSYVVAAGLMSGELTDATLTASRWSYDRRDIDPSVHPPDDPAARSSDECDLFPAGPGLAEAATALASARVGLSISPTL